MNWYRIKTVLIILFAAINLFLATLLCASQFKMKTQEKEKIQSAVNVLSASGIRVSCDVPYKTERLRVLTLENPKADPAAFAAAVLGGKVTRLGESYRREGKVLTFLEKGFYYDSGVQSVNPEKSSISEMEKALSALGFRTDFIHGYIEGNAVVFTQKIDSVFLFDCRLLAYPAENGSIARLEGTWAEIPRPEGERKKTQSAADALLSFLQAGNREEIVHVECGYAVLSKEKGYRTADAVPVWAITTIDGKVHYFDAR